MPVHIPIEQMSKACQEAARKARAESLPKVRAPEWSVLAKCPHGIPMSDRCDQCSEKIAAGVKKKPSIRIPKRRQMSGPERSYLGYLEKEWPAPDYRIDYERWSLLLANGTRYTMDFTVWHARDNKLVMSVEVKGAKRLMSADRSYLKFKSAIVEFPYCLWRFAEQDTDGGWKVETVDMP
jgi:hypothetical protein